MLVGPEPAVINVGIKIRKSVTLPRNVLIEGTSVETTACVKGCRSVVTSLNTEIDVHLTLTPSLIINLIGFYPDVFIMYSILGRSSVAVN